MKKSFIIFLFIILSPSFLFADVDKKISIEEIEYSILTLRAEYDLANIIVAIVINMVVVYAVLKSSGFLEKKLGNSGLNVLRKVFGVVLMAIAVKIFSANIQNLF